MLVKLLSCVQLFATPWSIAHQAPLSVGFSRQEYWSGLPFSSLGDLSNPGIKPSSPKVLECPLNTIKPVSGMVFSGYMPSRGILGHMIVLEASQVVLVVKNPLANAGD